MKKYNLKLVNELLEKKETRTALLENDLFLFSLYYFTEIFTHKASDFQKEICFELDNSKNLLIIWYRGSAKTTLTIIKIIQNICYCKSRFIVFFCAEKSKATARLYDIVVHLQTNRKLKNDFGDLFSKQKNKSNDGEDVMQKKSIPEFITSNHIKVKASSIWESPRGEIFFYDKPYRPDLVILDDIDTEKTVYSITQIEKNYNWIKWELFWSLQKNSRIIFLWNIIKNDWIVPRLETDYKQFEKWKILKKSLIENGEITWDYYNDENIEELKKQQWEIAFNQNYLLIPFSWWDTIIKRDQIKYYRDIKIFDKIIIWIDPAISEKTHSDSFWIVITWIIQGKYYVIEAIELKEKEKDPFKATEIIYNLYTKYNANLVVVETVAFQQVMAKLIKNKWIAIKEVKPRKDKMTRLLERQYLFDKWEIFFNNENTWTLINQLLDFPNVQHDDLVDWMIYSFQKNDKKFIFEQL